MIRSVCGIPGVADSATKFAKWKNEFVKCLRGQTLNFRHMFFNPKGLKPAYFGIVYSTTELQDEKKI